MEFLEIRRVMLTAIASDDELVDALVLKGGNALELIHKVGARASIDLDFSMAADFDDPGDVAARLKQALTDRFDSAGYLVFDFSFGPRPSTRSVGDEWGGYRAEFKLIERSLAQDPDFRLEDMRRQAEPVGPNQGRVFQIDISAFEWIEGRVRTEIDHYTCYVYSLEMIVAEKLRAICQQLPAYEKRANPAPRARDFYDIVAAMVEGGVSISTPSFGTLVQEMFRAKDVDPSLLREVEGQREFHRSGWPAVENAVDRSLRDFDYYFDYVVEEARGLEVPGVE